MVTTGSRRWEREQALRDEYAYMARRQKLLASLTDAQQRRVFAAPIEKRDALIEQLASGNRLDELWD